jgi:geranylgeranyl pyrophosphate synthase
VKLLAALYCYYPLDPFKDDYLDCYGDPAVTGKIGTDIEDNKCGWLVIQALNRADESQRQLLEVSILYFKHLCMY